MFISWSRFLDIDVLYPKNMKVGYFRQHKSSSADQRARVCVCVCVCACAHVCVWTEPLSVHVIWSGFLLLFSAETEADLETIASGPRKTQSKAFHAFIIHGDTQNGGVTGSRHKCNDFVKKQPQKGCWDLSCQKVPQQSPHRRLSAKHSWPWGATRRDMSCC